MIEHHPEILSLKAGARGNSMDVSMRDAVVLHVEEKDSMCRNKGIFGWTKRDTSLVLAENESVIQMKIPYPDLKQKQKYFI